MNVITTLMWTVMNFIKNNLIISSFLIIHWNLKMTFLVLQMTQTVEACPQLWELNKDLDLH